MNFSGITEPSRAQGAALVETQWRDYESTPSTVPFPDADGRGMWVEVPVRGKVKGDVTVRTFILEPPPPERCVRIVATGEGSVRSLYALCDK